MPTMVGMIGNSTDEILEIHSYHPILAFFLSICTPSTLPLRVSWSSRDEQPGVSNLEKVLLSKGDASYRIRTVPTWQIIIFHILAMIGAGGVIAQTVFLGERAFISFACWTSFWPIVSVMFSTAFVHVADVVWSRLCLGPKNFGEGNSLRWSWKIADVSDRLVVTRPGMAKLKNMATAVGTCVLYAWLTILFSSIQLVSATKAMRIVLGAYFTCAMAARGIVVWLLEVVPESPSTKDDWEGGDKDWQDS